MKARQALETAMQVEEQLRRARLGDASIGAALLAEFGKPLKISVKASPAKPMKIISDAEETAVLRRPKRPLHLNYDSQKNPFFRPRQHDEKHAMMLASRQKQAQNRHDRSDALHHLSLFAKTEDEFYQRLGLPDEAGWQQEINVARSVLHVQMERSSIRQSELWERMEETHENRWRRYWEELAIFKAKKKRAKEDAKRIASSAT
jgi:hypothetical protein